MEEQVQVQNVVTNKDVFRHYFSSMLIYGAILLFIIFCPILNSSVENDIFNYTTFFILYYIAYGIFSLPLYLWLKPESLLTSRNVAILNYFKRQFRKDLTLQQWLIHIEPEKDEKQAFMILFMKTFFGVYCVNVLCNKYLPGLDYDINFLKEMFGLALNYGNSSGFLAALWQFIDDTSDMWITIMLMLTNLIFAVSYLTELNLFRNKIKSVDTTPLGVISCIICYYPVILLTNQIIPQHNEELIPVDNLGLRIFLNILAVLVNFGALLSVARLGTKSGNLTNRGIETRFPYSIIRHPNYSMQICYIIIASIPVFLIPDYTVLWKILMAAGIVIWIGIYYLRAITEERHLIKDEAYQEYTQKVKYRFIPKVF